MAKVTMEVKFLDEQLRHIRDMVEGACQEWRNSLISVVNEAYSMGQKHDPIGKQEIINQIIAGRWDA